MKPIHGITPAEAAISQREEANDEAEREFQYNRREMEHDAHELIKTPEGIRGILEDQWLAHHLARITYNMEGAVVEISKLTHEHRVPENAQIALRNMVQAAAHLERELFTRKVDQMVEDA